MAPEAFTNRARRIAAVLGVTVLALSVIPLTAWAARKARTSFASRSTHSQLLPPRAIPYPNLEWPIVVNGGQYTPLSWADIAGWSSDDHVQAYKAFRVSCASIAVQRNPPEDSKALGASLREPCRAAKAQEITEDTKARAFFEANFLPLQISRLGEDAGFVTGYYEPIVDGSRVRTDVYNVPVYRRPSNLFVRGYRQSSVSLPNKGQVFRKIGRRKLVPYYDRGEIEDGAIAGRGLELCWLKNQTDLLFIQIQGSARVRFDDGTMMRLNYDAHNGFPYMAVGRVLIDRNIIPREQMSMQRIRDWMEQNPDGANDVRRQNRSYVFFHEVQLSDKDEAVGGQGVPLTAGRSIAVDRSIHAYGTPFFIDGMLPIESDSSTTPFHRLMIAQDTGSAIVGPARADLYFGAGAEAGQISGRLKNNANFAILVPKSLDPSARIKSVPLPENRPSATIAKLFPQTLPQPSSPPPADKSAKPVEVSQGAAPVVQTATVPLPQARPAIVEPTPAPLRRRRRRRR